MTKMSFDSDFFYVGWTDNDYNWPYPTVDIRAQKIDEAGNLLWGSEGINGSPIILIMMNLKDCCRQMLYLGKNYGIWTNYYLYAKLVDENGNTVPGWEENGTLISELEESVYDMTSKGFITSEGYLILWEDFRNGDTAIIGQLITEDGITLWQEGGIALVDFDGWQYNYSAIIDDELSNFYLVWEDYRNSNDREIYAQKFDVNGIELWQPGGVLLSEGRNPNLAKIGDHILVVWDIETEDYTNDIKAQLLNPSGEIQWQPGWDCNL